MWSGRRLSTSPGYVLTSSRDSIRTSHVPLLLSQRFRPLTSPQTERVSPVFPPRLPRVGPVYTACTSHSSRTWGTSEPPSSCRGDPVSMIPHGPQRCNRACSRSSLRPSSPRREGLPEEVERETEMHHLSLFCSSVSAIVRWCPH